MLVLALIGAVTARRWFWAGAAGIAALYALGVNGLLWSLLVQIVPALLWFRVPSRAWFVVALIAPLLAGYGLQWLIDAAILRRGVLIALIGATVGAGVRRLPDAERPGDQRACRDRRWRRLRRDSACWRSADGCAADRLALALIAVTFLDLAMAGAAGWNGARRRRGCRLIRCSWRERLTELGAYRVYSPTYSLQQQVAEEYHLRLFGGVDPFQLSGIVAAVEQGGGITSTGYSVVVPPLTWRRLWRRPTAMPCRIRRFSAQWGVTHVVSAYPLDVPHA